MQVIQLRRSMTTWFWLSDSWPFLCHKICYVIYIHSLCERKKPSRQLQFTYVVGRLFHGQELQRIHRRTKGTGYYQLVRKFLQRQQSSPRERYFLLGPSQARMTAEHPVATKSQSYSHIQQGIRAYNLGRYIHVNMYINGALLFKIKGFLRFAK